MTLLNAKASQCKWPLWDDLSGEMASEAKVCGDAILDGKSYCLRHHKISIGPGTISERSAHRDLIKMHRRELAA